MKRRDFSTSSEWGFCPPVRHIFKDLAHSQKSLTRDISSLTLGFRCIVDARSKKLFLKLDLTIDQLEVFMSRITSEKGTFYLFNRKSISHLDKKDITNL